jgi:hypothetical protein
MNSRTDEMSASADPVAAYPVKTRSPNVTSISVRFGGLYSIVVVRSLALGHTPRTQSQARKPHLAKRPT